MFTRRVSVLALYNPQKELLLQHRTKDAPYYPDFWGFFGGEIDEGETPEEALIREAQEELLLTIHDVKLFKRFEIKEDTDLYERNVFLVPTSLTTEQLRKQQREGAGLGFFTLEKTKDLKFNVHNRIILEEIFDELRTMV